MLDLIATLITRLILSLQATITAITCLVAFLTIRSRIRPTKVVEIVPLTVILPILLTINLEQKATNVVENPRVIIAPQIVNQGSLISSSSFSTFKSYISCSQITPPLDIAAALAPIYTILRKDIPYLTQEDLRLGALQLGVLYISVCDFN